MSATSTTDLEPLSDHGAPPQVRRITAVHVAPPRASRHFSARQILLKYGFLNPTSHMHMHKVRLIPMVQKALDWRINSINSINPPAWPSRSAIYYALIVHDTLHYTFTRWWG